MIILRRCCASAMFSVGWAAVCRVSVAKQQRACVCWHRACLRAGRRRLSGLLVEYQG